MTRAELCLHLLAPGQPEWDRRKAAYEASGATASERVAAAVEAYFAANYPEDDYTDRDYCPLREDAR